MSLMYQSKDKKNINSKNNSNDDTNSNIFNRIGSQSSLSVDLNRFKINPNNFNKNKDNNSKIYNNNQININLDENFETFNPGKDKIISNNNSNRNLNINNKRNIENSNKSKNANANILNTKKKDPLLGNFNPYDIKNFLGEDYSPNKKGKTKKKLNLVNNISPSTSNLQMILYNKKIERLKNQNNPNYLFKEFYQKESRRMIVEYLKVLNLSYDNSSIKEIMTNENINQLILLKPIKDNILNNSIINNNNDNPYYNPNKKSDPFSIIESPNGRLMESSTKNFINTPNSFKILNNFINDMDDESKDKMFLITFLSIPRIMNMIISKEQKFSFVFYCSPTNISCLYGIETYIFKWNECKNYNLMGYFDLINVENCYLDDENKKIFNIILNNNKSENEINNDEINEKNNYCIEAYDEETAYNYVQAINFTSQLVKYRIYLREKKNKNDKGI